MSRKITKKKHLEILLENIPNHPKPKVELEQYSTPSIIASDLLWNAKTLGDIENKNILDLACGTGIFAIASKVLGGGKVKGYDIDSDAINTARETSYNLGLDIDFEVKDLVECDYLENVDTIFQNPPFGSQKNAKKGIDTKFIDLAVKSANNVYSFHMASTEEYITNYFTSKDFNITHKFHYHFPLSKIYKFHTKESYNVDVVVIRGEKEI